MGKIYNSMEEMIGETPLVRLRNLEKTLGLSARLLAKTESRNPGGSAKDRVALSMLNAMEKDGKLLPGGTVIEPTSGNTGIGLAAVGAARGYHVVIVMPDSMSMERRALIGAYGAEIVLTPGNEGMAGAIRRAEEISRQIPHSVIAGQFENPANPEAHYRTTGPELWRDADGEIDCFVAGAGTGGTVSGVGRYLKEQNGAVRIIAVEPDVSAVLSGGEPGPHLLQGIGAGFVPATLDRSVIDEVFPVSGEDAYRTAELMAAKEGILIGVSGGAALYAAIRTAERQAFSGKTVAVLLPDSGERYLSTPGFLKPDRKE